MHFLLARLERLLVQSRERGIATVEYLVTALVATTLIGVMVTVPIASEPTARQGFKDGICKIFEVGGIGGGCSTGNGQTPDGETPNDTADPNDTPPVCSVHKSSESNKVKLDIKFVTAEGEFTIRKEIMSDGTIRYTVVGGVGGSAGVETPTEGAEAGAKAKARLNLGDTWIYDPKSEEGKNISPEAFEQQIRDYAGWKVADKATSGGASTVGNMFNVVPPEPRGPDITSGDIEVGVEANAKVGKTLDTPDGGEAGAELQARLGANGTVGMSVNNKDGSTTYSIALGVDGSASGKVSTGSSKAGEVSAKGELSAGMKDTVYATYDKDGNLTGIKIQQAREFNATATAEAKLGNGPKSSIGSDGKLYTVTTAEMDLTKMSPEQRKLAQDWLHSGMIAPDLSKAMDNGLDDKNGYTAVHNDFAKMLWQNSRMSRNQYAGSGADGTFGSKDEDDGLGLSFESSISKDTLVSAEYALPADGSNKRAVVENTNCLSEIPED